MVRSLGVLLCLAIVLAACSPSGDADPVAPDQATPDQPAESAQQSAESEQQSAESERAASTEAADDAIENLDPGRALVLSAETWQAYTDVGFWWMWRSEAAPLLAARGLKPGQVALIKWLPERPPRIAFRGLDPTPGEVEQIAGIAEELADLTGMEWEIVEDQRRATLFVWLVNDFDDFAGTRDIDAHELFGFGGPGSLVNQRIISGRIIIDLSKVGRGPSNLFGHVVLHEFLHSLGLCHMTGPRLSVMQEVTDGLISLGLSETDRQMIRLHYHPSIEPGMTGEEVLETIEFVDVDSGEEPGPPVFAERASLSGLGSNADFCPGDVQVVGEEREP